MGADEQRVEHRPNSEIDGKSNEAHGQSLLLSFWRSLRSIFNWEQLRLDPLFHFLEPFLWRVWPAHPDSRSAVAVRAFGLVSVVIEGLVVHVDDLLSKLMRNAEDCGHS